MSKGAGDLNIKVECMNLQETYSIEDCEIYDTSIYNVPPNNSITQIDNISFDNSSDWEVSYIINSPSSSNRVVVYSPNGSNYVGLGFSSGGYEAIYWYDTSGHDQGFNLLSYNTDYLITIKKENGNVLVYRDGTLRKTISGTGAVVGQTLNIGERNWGSGTGTVKNIKVKPL